MADEIGQDREKGANIKKPVVAMAAAALFLIFGATAAVLAGWRLSSADEASSGGDGPIAQEETQAIGETDSTAASSADALHDTSVTVVPSDSSTAHTKGENAMTRKKAAAAALSAAMAAAPLAAALAFCMAMFNQLSGICAVLYFARRVFQLAGCSSETALAVTAWLTALMLPSGSTRHPPIPRRWAVG